jgi:hypothetical protein
VGCKQLKQDFLARDHVVPAMNEMHVPTKAEFQTQRHDFLAGNDSLCYRTKAEIRQAKCKAGSGGPIAELDRVEWLS